MISGEIVFPGASYLCMALEAICQVVSEHQSADTVHRFIIRDVVFSKPLVVPEAPGKVEIQLSLTPRHRRGNNDMRGWNKFWVSSQSSDGTLSEHCQGVIIAELASSVTEAQESYESVPASATETGIYQKTREQCSQMLDTDELYKRLEKNGNHYGPNFAILKEFRLSDQQAVAKLRVPDIATSMPSGFMQPHVIHPATLDALFQAAIPLYLRCRPFGAIMPASIKELVISPNIATKIESELLVATDIVLEGQRNATANAYAFQTSTPSKADPVISISQVEIYATGQSNQAVSDLSSGQDMTYQMEWGVDVNHLTTEPPKANVPVHLEQRCESLDRAAAFLSKCVSTVSTMTSAMFQIIIWSTYWRGCNDMQIRNLF